MAHGISQLVCNETETLTAASVRHWHEPEASLAPEKVKYSPLPHAPQAMANSLWMVSAFVKA